MRRGTRVPRLSRSEEIDEERITGISHDSMLYKPGKFATRTHSGRRTTERERRSLPRTPDYPNARVEDTD